MMVKENTSILFKFLDLVNALCAFEKNIYSGVIVFMFLTYFLSSNDTIFLSVSTNLTTLNVSYK
jgi:hypothetical protein